MARRKIDKAALANLIRNLEGLDNEQRADLLQLLNEQKRYGLVWEDHIEDAEELLREKLPVFIEDKNKRLDKGGQDAPNHVLIEGDNLHALSALSYTHEGMVDVIYIDPPYNTGARDWKYNNQYVDGLDYFRHSKWLSWLDKRLRISKKLLKRTGIIVVTIDDYEVAQLRILLDEIYGNENYLGTIVIRNNPSGRSTVRGLSINHEYAICFAKSELSTLGRLEHNEAQKSRYSEKDEEGYFEWENFRKNGTDSDRKDRPKQFYPIVIDTLSGKLRIPSIQWDSKKREYIIEEMIFDNEVVILPIQSDGNEKVWKYGIERCMSILDEIKVKKTKVGYELYRKKYLNDEGSLPHSWWDKPAYSARDNGTRMLTNIFGPNKVFDFPKAPEAVKDSLVAANLPKNGIVLDFFAGSGTTLHATMQLNAEDGGHRQCILVTNNENNICEEVTYERNKRVIEGYTTPKGEHVEGLKNNNLRYYKTEFVNRAKTSANMKELMKKSLDILCIKENLYEEKSTFEGLKLAEHIARYFTDGTTTPSTKQMLIIYEPAAIPVIVKRIEKMQLEGDNKLLVYVMSDGQYPFTEDFASVLGKIKLYAMPHALYQAMRQVTPTPNAEEPQEQDIEISDEEADSSIYKTDEE